MGNTEALQDIVENRDIEHLLTIKNEIVNRTRTINNVRTRAVLASVHVVDADATGVCAWCVVCTVPRGDDLAGGARRVRRAAVEQRRHGRRRRVDLHHLQIR